MLKAVADLLRSIAWPIVALTAAIVFRKEVSALSARLRKLSGTEFDPPQQTTSPNALAAAASDSPSTTVATNAAEALDGLPTTPATTSLEATISAFAAVKNVTDPGLRAKVLLRIAARAILMGSFEVTDAQIYKSQLALLHHLNNNRSGVALDVLRTLFYEPAVAENPALYRNDTFGRYLTYLTTKLMVELKDDVARITPNGTEYLAWRVEMGKPPKTHG